MTCYTHDTFADRLDDLLTGDEASAFDRHVAACPTCAFTLSQAATRHARLATPFAVPEPAADLKARIRADHARRAPARTWRVLRYAASFAAGVLVTIAAHALAPVSETPIAEPPPANRPTPAADISIPSLPRRIH